MKRDKRELIEYYENGPGIISSTYPDGEKSSLSYQVDSLVGWHRVLKHYIDRFDFSGLILDMGCGTGHWSEVLSEKCNVVSCDLSKRALKMARVNGRSVGYVKCDAEKLPFKDSSFDHIISIATLEHVVDDLPVVSEAKRTMKSKGSALFNVPNKNPSFLGKTFWLTKFGRKNSPWERAGGHLREYSKKEIRFLSEKSGMTIVDLSYSWILFAPVASVIALLLFRILKKNNFFSKVILFVLRGLQDMDNLIERFPRSTNINFVLMKN